MVDAQKAAHAALKAAFEGLRDSRERGSVAEAEQRAAKEEGDRDDQRGANKRHLGGAA